jgi:hypothetical protein
VSAAKDRKDAREQRDVLAMQALAELLKRVCAEPAIYLPNHILATALKSQGALAKYELAESPIHGMSLNHQKAVAEKSFGSYEILDGLRRAAIDALSAERLREKRGNTVSKVGLKARVKELEAERLLLLEELMLLQRVFDLRCLQARQYASNADKATLARCTKEQRELDITLSLRRRPAPKTNVTPIQEARRHGRA